MRDKLSNITYQLAKKYTDSHGGGGGTSDYEQLSHLPKINSVTLKGNKTASDLGLATEDEITAIQDGAEIDSFSDVETALGDKADAPEIEAEMLII